ncbi:MAG: DUF420 domain-containing protein [Nitrospira sp.]|jgi:uncharacterized membrane protein YozB (DUF420 family)|uniref:DUF420 domain-containing protein n=1 Tax=Candidatus Nitrospira inopinata TaxID=1715989 RepID=A0A0S4KYB5_9BACT|nr:DUF420 domain-containing protein [Candidatus Nitrospira inopinata]MCA1957293.1 DUF420 domain-containing protein [Nitrospira sp.]CUQ68320.1 conserved membrane protein of unknown function [Candidatus Nitrospira inopinata]
MDWLRESGFFGTHATVGADLSQLMATLFTVLFIVGWVQARKQHTDAHHWLMLGGMISMAGFFVVYYLFRQLGVLAFEGKEGFGGSQELYDRVFVPVLILHITLVIVGLIMAVYLIVLGFRVQTFVGGKRRLKAGPRQASWGAIAKLWTAVGGLIGTYLLYLHLTDRLSMRRSSVWIAFMLIFTVVLLMEMAIQRIWPDGAQRHRALGRFTMVIYCVLFVTGSFTYTMLYILYPGKIG